MLECFMYCRKTVCSSESLYVNFLYLVREHFMYYQKSLCDVGKLYVISKNLTLCLFILRYVHFHYVENHYVNIFIMLKDVMFIPMI